MNIPLFFTLFRMFFSPFLLAPLIALKAPIFFVFFLYCFLALTDFLDGFFARFYTMVSIKGAFLDQFADKIFLFSVLIPLVFLQRCLWWWALLISIREIFVMGLREYALQYGISLPVSIVAKYKTALQMIFFGLLILQPLYDNVLITSVLFIAMISASYYSAYGYCRKIVL